METTTIMLLFVSLWAAFSTAMWNHWEKQTKQREQLILKIHEKYESQDDLLQQIEQWCQAYPLDIFPEPDLTKARAALSKANITLDSISAGAMRYVVTRIEDMIIAERKARQNNKDT